MLEWTAKRRASGPRLCRRAITERGGGGKWFRRLFGRRGRPSPRAQGLPAGGQCSPAPQSPGAAGGMRRRAPGARCSLVVQPARIAGVCGDVAKISIIRPGASLRGTPWPAIAVAEPLCCIMSSQKRTGTTLFIDTNRHLVEPMNPVFSGITSLIYSGGVNGRTGDD